MSVYTRVQRPELQDFFAQYSLGSVQDWRGISAGITNTNYFVDTDQARWVLTIFEHDGPDALNYCLPLMAHLVQNGIVGALPQRQRNGAWFGQLYGKPAAVVACLNGQDITNPNENHIAQMGEVLAKLHLAGQHFAQKRDNIRGFAWREATAQSLLPRLKNEEALLLADEIHWQAQHRLDHLPQGVIHADLFRDNVLFDADGQLAGLIDFYYACHDSFLYDVAVTVNDWCRLANDQFCPDYTTIFLQNYQSIRPFSVEEKQSWHAALRAAALRFWLSRLLDWHFPKEGEMTHRKDPNVFKNILLTRRAQTGRMGM